MARQSEFYEFDGSMPVEPGGPPIVPQLAPQPTPPILLNPYYRGKGNKISANAIIERTMRDQSSFFADLAEQRQRQGEE